MREQDPGSKPDFSFEGTRDTLEKKGSEYKDRLKDTADDLSRRNADLDRQKASDLDREDSRGDRGMSDSGPDRGDAGMQSSERQGSDHYAGQNRREMDKHLDPSDS